MVRDLAAPSAVSITTARLTIESIGPEHIDALLAYYRRNEKHLARWEPARSPDFFSRGYWARYAAAVQDDAYHGRAHRFVALLPGEAEVVASVNVTNVVHGVFRGGVLGYSVDEAYQAQGYGSEAVGAVVEWCFRDIGLHRVEANYQPNNERSGRLLRSLGFTVEGYARDYLYIDGAWRDHILTAKIDPAGAAGGESRARV